MTNTRRGPDSASWRGDAVGYRAVHRRLRSSRGEAREHACTGCGKPAAQWAYTYAANEPWRLLAFSTNLTRYRPLCGSCHAIYDKSRPGRTEQAGQIPLQVRVAALALVGAGSTQREVAATLGVTQQAVSRWMVRARADQEG